MCSKEVIDLFTLNLVKQINWKYAFIYFNIDIVSNKILTNNLLLEIGKYNLQKVACRN